MMDDPDPPIDPADFASLELETPILVRVRQFALGLQAVNWFARLGEHPTPKVREAAARYLDQLGFPDADLAIVADYDDAAAVSETYDWASPAWEAEELLRADLTERARALLSDDALEIGLRLVAQYVGDAARSAAEEQAALWDIARDDEVNLAVGAAVQAATLAALVLICEAEDGAAEEDAEGDHAFVWKMRLFELGRWPVAIVGNSFSVF